MDDSRRGTRSAAVLLFAALSLAQSGCSLFVMAGKMIFGDPKIPCAFRQSTRVDLTRGEYRVLVMATTPEALRAEWSSLSVDLLDGVTRRLKIQSIRVVNPDNVATWIDDHGGGFDDPAALADEFDADFIIHINLDRFTHREERSSNLYRGQAHGNITAHEVRKVNGRTAVNIVFDREFNSTWPATYPMSSDQIDGKVFLKRYMDRVCAQISYLFYDHRLSEEME